MHLGLTSSLHVSGECLIIIISQKMEVQGSTKDGMHYLLLTPPEINYYYYLINGSSALSARVSEEMFAGTYHHCECCLCFDFQQGFHLGRMDLKSGSEPQLPILLISFLNVYPCLAFATINQYPG